MHHAIRCSRRLPRPSSLRSALVMALLLCAPAVAYADAPVVTHVEANQWQETEFRDPVNPGCSIGGWSSVAGGRLILGASKRRPSPMNMLIRKPGWEIPQRTAVKVVASFPNGASYALTGMGKGQDIQFDVAGPALRNWIHDLTANSSMQVSFGGSEPAWSFDLSGTTKVVNAMGDCFQALGIQGVEPPFGQPPTATAQVGQPGTSQPFGAPLPLLTAPPAPQPFAQGPSPLSPAFQVAPASPQAQTPPPPSIDESLASWSGQENLTTRPFHVDGPWEVQWSNDAGMFILRLNRLGGSSSDLLEMSDKAGHSSAFQPNGGDYYLTIVGTQPWSVRIVPVRTTATPSPQPQAEPALPAPAPETTAMAAPATPRALPASPPPASLQEASDPSEPPNDELGLIAAVEAARQQYNIGANDMAKGAARPLRAQAICRALPSHSISGWIGKVDELTTNGDGKGVISITIGPDIYVKTWNNALSDISDHTLIDPASTVFQEASALQKGAPVRFSAVLIDDPTDCVKESSMTMSGSISEPEYIMRLTDIRPLN